MQAGSRVGGSGRWRPRWTRRLAPMTIGSVGLMPLALAIASRARLVAGGDGLRLSPATGRGSELGVSGRCGSRMVFPRAASCPAPAGSGARGGPPSCRARRDGAQGVAGAHAQLRVGRGRQREQGRRRSCRKQAAPAASLPLPAAPERAPPLPAQSAFLRRREAPRFRPRGGRTPARPLRSGGDGGAGLARGHVAGDEMPGSERAQGRLDLGGRCSSTSGQRGW